MSQPWAENEWPTPEQLCDWVLGQPREQQIEHFRKTIERAEMAAHCFMMNHELLQEELDHLRKQFGELHTACDAYRSAWAGMRYALNASPDTLAHAWTDVMDQLEADLQSTGGRRVSDFVRGFGVPIMMNNRLSDGQVISTVDPITRGKVVYIGTHKTYVDSTIRRITREVFPREFLERIGMWQPTGEEVLQTLKGAGK